MKRLHAVAVVISLFLAAGVLVSCGGGGSSGGSNGGGGTPTTTPSQAAMDALATSFAGIQALVQDAAIQPCFSGQSASCVCPGGGAVSASGQTILFSSCASSSAGVFDGSLTMSGSTIDGIFAVFGACVNATTSGLSSNGCSGTVAGTCSGESVSGTVVHQSGANCTVSYTGGATEPTAEISLITPYVSESEFHCIPEAYDASTAHTSPWGFEHLGIDMQPVASGAHIQAVADGTVDKIERYQNPNNSLWQVNMAVRYNSTYTYEYYFEPQAPSDAALQPQVDAIVVAVGQAVKQGDPIGSIVQIGSEMLVHFDLWKDTQNICPEPYFTPEADASLLRLLHVCRPDANLCYQ